MHRKLKIGNFERLVQTYFEQQVAPKDRFASYGYSNYDCSGIVNPLASIVEIEFKALLKDYIDEWGLVEKEGKKPTLGSIVRVHDHERGKDFLTDVTTVANFDKNDVLAIVINLVDSNLNDIMSRLNKLLAEKLKISQSSLRKIEKWRSPVMPESYCFQYCPTGIEGQLTYVFTSVNGDVKEVFCTI